MSEGNAGPALRLLLMELLENKEKKLAKQDSVKDLFMPKDELSPLKVHQADDKVS